MVRKHKKILTMWVLTAVGSSFAYLNAFALADASTVVPVMELSTIVAVVGGIVLLRERTDVLRKLAGTAAVIAGVVLALV